MNKLERLKWILPMTGNSTSKEKIRAADNIIQNRIFNLNSYFDVYVNTNKDWTTKSNSRSLRRWLHTHIFLSDFSRAYAETKNEKYFKESFKLLEDWFEKFPINDRDNIEKIAYHDEGTSIRLLFWFKYYCEFYNLFNDEQSNMFESRIDETAELLSREEFYAGMNNHGMFQDMGLVAYSLFKFEDFSASETFKNAMNRIVKYYNEVFTPEGIHKEHAPSYHVLLLHSLKQLLVSMNMADYEDSNTCFLNEMLSKGENYVINIITPDFKLPNISDSVQINMATNGAYKKLFDSDEYKFITSAGQLGTAPQILINAYPESGYFIARDEWSKNSIYFLFLASYHMHYHKHTDDLSFILYKKGPIFVDAGPHSYNYNDPMTQYAYSQYAHSTVIVNNKSLPRTDYKFKDVFINDTMKNEDKKTFFVEGINSRFKDTKHIRKITGNLVEETFRILDTIISDSRNNYKLLFQIDGNLNVIQHGHVLSIFKNKAKIAEMEIVNYDNLNNLKVKVVSEKKWPHIMGYQFPKSEMIQPLNTVIIEGSNIKSEVNIEIDIKLKNFKVTGNNTFEKKDKFNVQGDISYIYEDFGHKKLAVVFNSTETPFKYPIASYDEIFNKKEYNILYINDNQFEIGSSFIKGRSTSTIESDIESIILSIINKFNFKLDDVLLFGKSKAGFAALYYGLKNGFKNIISITPLSILGDYYSRHNQYSPLIDHLADGHEIERLSLLNNYIFDINLNNYPLSNNIYIGVGENDYHKEKHTYPILKWLEFNNIEIAYKEYENVGFNDTNEEDILKEII